MRNRYETIWTLDREVTLDTCHVCIADCVRCFQGKHFCVGQKRILFFSESVTMIDPENIQTKHVNLCFSFYRFILSLLGVWTCWFEDRQNDIERTKKKTRTLKSYVLYSVFYSLLLSLPIRTLKLFAMVTVNCHGS